MPAEDIPGVAELWEEAGLPRPWNDPVADIHRALDGRTSTVLVHRSGTGVAGTVMVGYDGHRGWVYYVAVRRADRGRGIGRALLTAAEDWLRERGAVKVQLMVRHGNDVGAYYEQLGYADVGATTYGKWLTGP
ncbi:GNAT family acetyltransferase [Arthrobacter sp. RIT-PI-e]|uniref:GNAT family acetyltransferase n=1 Tax=Arthrobacter sp. RIT-PI-e TaxID=1681197 RepID=UPI0022865689|nr:GNAT family acetyltransferase [Arthrobacter sp. RIT-PI-e]